MPRKGPADRRELTPDPVYRSTVVTQLVNKVLQRGKRSTAERIVYTALGHIHRSYPVAGSSARYCGSPIPYSLTEMSTARVVVDPVGLAASDPNSLVHAVGREVDSHQPRHRYEGSIKLPCDHILHVEC